LFLASESGDEHGTDSRLSHDDGLIVHRPCDQHGEEGRQRQSPYSATGELHHQLSDCNADHYPDQQPDSVRPSAPESDVKTHNGRDRREERLGVSSEPHRDHPCGYSRGGLLRNRPD
jgi:hypothetical protein